VQLAIKDDWKNPEVTGELLFTERRGKDKGHPQRFTALIAK